VDYDTLGTTRHESSQVTIGTFPKVDNLYKCNSLCHHIKEVQTLICKLVIMSQWKHSALRIPSHIVLHNANNLCSIFTVFKSSPSWQDFPQKDTEAVNIIFDRSWRAGICKHLRCHIRNCSTPFASSCLCCSLLFPFWQTKVTYLHSKYCAHLFWTTTALQTAQGQLSLPSL